MRSLIYIIAAFLLSGSAIAASTELSGNSASDQLASVIDGAKEIEIAHTSRYVIFRTPTKLSKEDVVEGWRVKISFRCGVCSGNEAPSKLASLIRKSINISNSCEDFRSRITAKDERGKVVATAWGDVSGRCIETDAGSFVLDGNYWDYLDAELAPPRL